MIVTVGLLFVAAFHVVGLLGTVSSIGLSRRPIEPTAAVLIVVISCLTAIVCVVAAVER